MIRARVNVRVHLCAYACMCHRLSARVFGVWLNLYYDTCVHAYTPFRHSPHFYSSSSTIHPDHLPNRTLKDLNIHRHNPTKPNTSLHPSTWPLTPISLTPPYPQNFNALQHVQHILTHTSSSSTLLLTSPISNTSIYSNTSYRYQKLSLEMT